MYHIYRRLLHHIIALNC